MGFFCSESDMNLYANAHSMGNKQELGIKQELGNSCRSVVLLGSWRCGGVVCMTGGLQWRNTDFMEKTDKEDEKGELFFM